jgi:uncharacterized membrane protein
LHAGTGSGFNQILYGYGLSAAAFLITARWFRKTDDDRLVIKLESGALILCVLLVTLEI